MKTNNNLAVAAKSGLVVALIITLGWANARAASDPSAPVALPRVLVEGTLNSKNCPWQIRAAVASPSAQAAVSQCGKLLASKDGDAWRQVEPNLRTFFRCVLFDRGVFVAVGGSYVDLLGVILTSRDGENWTIRRCGSKIILHSVTCGNGLFLAVGDNGLVLTSKDGAEWRSQKSEFGGTLASVAFGNGRFVAAGDDGVALVSVDGRG